MMKTESLIEFINRKEHKVEEDNILRVAPQFDCGSFKKLISISAPSDWKRAKQPFEKLILQFEGGDGIKFIVTIYALKLTEDYRSKLDVREVEPFVMQVNTEISTHQWRSSPLALMGFKNEVWVPYPVQIEEALDARAFTLEETTKLTFIASLAKRFFAILGASNTEVISNKVDDRVNAKRIKNGKSPLRGYSTIKIHLPGTRVVSEYKGGTHASPIPHSRRSHRRVYKSGKEIWVRDHQVMRNPKDVVPQRTYEVYYTV